MNSLGYHELIAWQVLRAKALPLTDTEYLWGLGWRDGTKMASQMASRGLEVLPLLRRELRKRQAEYQAEALRDSTYGPEGDTYLRGWSQFYLELESLLLRPREWVYVRAFSKTGPDGLILLKGHFALDGSYVDHIGREALKREVLLMAADRWDSLPRDETSIVRSLYHVRNSHELD